MVFGVRGCMYILLLKWVSGLSFGVPPEHTAPEAAENRRGFADYFKISVEIFAKSSCIFRWDTVCLA